MTVGELRQFLNSYPDELQVIISTDGEGNNYSPLAGADEALYVAETSWYGEVYMTNAQVDGAPNYYTDEDRAPEDAVGVILLWPVN